LAEDIEPSEFANKHGFHHVKSHPTHKNIHVFQKHNDSVEVDSLQKSEHVLWSEKQEPKWHFKRFLPHDPLFASQWHLHDTPGRDLNVMNAWNLGFTGKGIVIGVVDDGLQSSHPDFAGNYHAQASYDFNGGDSDPEPASYDSHGTEAAGAAAAGANTVCGVGTAPEARVAGLRLIGEAVDDYTESLGLGYKPDDIHIYTCSWGPQDDGRRLEGPGTLSLMSIDHNIKFGRGGKGSIYAWAAGNGRRSSDNCNYDGYANHRYTISIGAIDFTGVEAWYSEECAMLLAVTPSSGGSRNIFTTDLKGRAGASYDDCASTFGGTSAASPMAAGIIALALQRRPELTWRDVQGVLIKSTTRVDPSDNDWGPNGAGLYFNHKYGFGKLDAEKVVQTAATWELLPAYVSTTCSVNMVYSLSSTPTRVTCSINSTGLIVEHVELQTDITSNYRGKVSISLESPSGCNSVIANSRGDVGRNIPFGWKWATLRTWGEQASGQWTVVVKSSDSTDRLNKILLTVYGHKSL